MQITQIEADIETARDFRRFLLTWFAALLERSIAAIDNAAEVSKIQIMQL